MEPLQIADGDIGSLLVDYFSDFGDEEELTAAKTAPASSNQQQDLAASAVVLPSDNNNEPRKRQRADDDDDNDDDELSSVGPFRTETKRQQHNASQRRRTQRLNENITALRSILERARPPSFSGAATESKSDVVSATIEYIEMLEQATQVRTVRARATTNTHSTFNSLTILFPTEQDSSISESHRQLQRQRHPHPCQRHST
jgi:hypothetical protein